MKIADPKKAIVSMIFDALNRVDELISKYTGENWAETCTSFDSPTNSTGLPNDETLKECLFFSTTAAEAFVIGLGADWPENRILREKLINLRNRWIDFIEKDPDLYLNFIEFHYLNRILSSWEENLGIRTVENDNNSTAMILGWHYAIALVLLQEAGTLPITIGKKELTIQQAKKQFGVDEKIADKIYHSTKNMKYKSKVDDIKWNIEYFFRTYAPKYHVGYKEVVLELLKGDEDATTLLKKLPD